MSTTPPPPKSLKDYSYFKMGESEPSGLHQPSKPMKLGFKEKLEVHRMVQSHATNIKVEPLVGYDNYTQWAQRLETYFMVSSLDDIILRDEKPDETDSSDDWKSYKSSGPCVIF